MSKEDLKRALDRIERYERLFLDIRDGLYAVPVKGGGEAAAVRDAVVDAIDEWYRS